MNVRDEMTSRAFSVRVALEERMTGGGLFAQMSDERFLRFIAAQVRAFNECRNEANDEAGEAELRAGATYQRLTAEFKATEV